MNDMLWQRVHIGYIGNKGSVSALSAEAYTTSLYVLVEIAKGGGREPPPYQAGLTFHHDEMYARKPLPLCLYSVGFGPNTFAACTLLHNTFCLCTQRTVHCYIHFTYCISKKYLDKDKSRL
jgi:hypothetical protein